KTRNSRPGVVVESEKEEGADKKLKVQHTLEDLDISLCSQERNRILTFPCWRYLSGLDMLPQSAAMAVLFYAVCCGGQTCDLTKPYFKSRNFFSVLHWDPVDIPGQSMLYSNISTPVCDLTDVMSEVTSTVAASYRAVVSIGNLCIGDVKFNPFRETPEVSVMSNATHLNVTASPPRMPWNQSIENMSNWRTRHHPLTSSSVQYTVQITRPQSKEYVSWSRSLFIWLLETDVQYCGVVYYTLTHPAWFRPSENTTFCHNVSAPNSLFHILIWPCFLAVFMVICLSITFYQLRGKGKHELTISLFQIIPGNKPQIPFCSYPKDEFSDLEVRKNHSVINLEAPDFTALESGNRESSVPYASQKPYRHSQDALHQSTSLSSVSYSLCLPGQIPNQSSNKTSIHSPDPERLSAGSASDLCQTQPLTASLINIHPNFSNVNQHSGLSDGTSSLQTEVFLVQSGNTGLQINNLFFVSVSESKSTAQGDKHSPKERCPLLNDLIEMDSDYLPVHIMSTDYKRGLLLSSIDREEQEEQRTYIMRPA
ncbi:hypothetical protein DNTS_011799, partial [Danionella cerebrum]